MNVWFSQAYVDVLQAGTMRPFYEWLLREPDATGTGLVDGGADGLAGFNHPGREPGRFQEFTYDARLRRRFVSMEIFNRGDDYLFEGYADGRSSPLCACLNAGWRTGLSGVTDEHGTDWGFPEGKGRTGLWVKEHSRAGVREAMRARRFFATRTSGLRLDATLEMAGRAHRMGRTLPVSRGRATFRLDLARDADWRGRLLHAPGAAARARGAGGGRGRAVPGRGARHPAHPARLRGRRLGGAAGQRPRAAQRHPGAGRSSLQRPRDRLQLAVVAGRA